MSKTKKKISAIFFIFLGFLPFIILLSFHLHKIVVRHRMIEKLERENLQVITIAEEDVKWVNKHEIWINERMFDIKESKLENGIYRFEGLYDEEETELKKNYERTSEKNKQGNQLLSQFFKWVQTTYHLAENIALVSFNSLHVFTSFKTSFFQNFPHEVATPPPRH